MHSTSHTDRLYTAQFEPAVKAAHAKDGHLSKVSSHKFIHFAERLRFYHDRMRAEGKTEIEYAKNVDAIHQEAIEILLRIDRQRAPIYKKRWVFHFLVGVEKHRLMLKKLISKV
mgnify:CR=1 FL=1